MTQPPALPDIPSPVPFETEAQIIRTHRRMWQFAVRNRHVTIPLAVPAAMLAAGAILHGAHLGFEAGLTAAAASVTTWFVAAKAEVTRDGQQKPKWPRDPRIRDWRWASELAYVRSTVGGGTLWLFLAAMFGPTQTWLEVMLGALCAAWGGLFWWHKRPRDRKARRRHERHVQSLNMWWQMHAPAWSAGGSGIVDVRDHDGLESWLVQLWGGRQTHAVIRNLLPSLESALGGYVHHGMARSEINKANPSQVWIHLKRQDPLREVIEWDDSMAPGDITKPAPLGVKETGGWKRASLRKGWFIIGRTRSGKSNEESVMLATITRCRNARVLLIDRKGGRAARPWLPALDWVATSIEEARLVLRCMTAETAARGMYAYNGDEQLTPTDEVPTLFVFIDEAFWVTGETSGDARCAADLATISGAGQGVEIYPVVISQYGALDTTVRTEQTRSNLNGRMCFQTEHAEHGVFALGEDARNGIDATKLEQKGTFYFREDAKTSPEQIRAPHFPHALARPSAVRNAELTDLYSRPLRLYCGAQPISDEEGAPTWQQVYDGRWSRLPAEFRRDAPQAAGPDAPAPPEDRTMPANKINLRPEHPEAAAINADVAGDPDITDAAILAARQAAAARGEPVDLLTEQDRRRHRFATLLQQAPQPPSGITPAQLKASGMGRTFIHQQLNALIIAGAVIKTGDGLYSATADVWAAMEKIRRDGDDLAAEARQMAGV
jgi:hypothetical protein